MPENSHFCSSPLRNNKIPIHDMHKHKCYVALYLCNDLFHTVLFHETSQDKLCSAMKRCIVTYRCIDVPHSVTYCPRSAMHPWRDLHRVSALGKISPILTLGNDNASKKRFFAAVHRAMIIFLFIICIHIKCYVALCLCNSWFHIALFGRMLSRDMR